jgi:4,5-DOPA dioxygenase extradiol
VKDLTRRRFLIGASAAAALGSMGRSKASADQSVDETPIVFVSHGGPNLAVSEERGRELRAWGQTLPRPGGIVSLTPHYRARGRELGAVGPGRGARSYPRRFADQIGDIDYRTPDNTELARRVEALLSTNADVERSGRTGNDHTTWMPLLHLFPDADVPVLELALPFARDQALFDLGRALGELRHERILIHCSGQMTHNLAMLGRSGPPAPWAAAFDDWVRERIDARDWDALVDWRRAAPDPYLAHPDDGGHYDVLLVALGAANATGLSEVRYPVGGFELGALSKRCIDLR